MDHPVIIIGAGPAGLLLAIELRLGGVDDVVIVEKLHAPTGQSRGLGFTCVTKDVFDQRGLLGEFGKIEISDAGHFGGIPVDFSVLEGSQQAAKTVPQHQTEAVLETRALKVGVRIERGVELLAFAATADGVEVETRDAAGEVRRRRCAYLVGCDGGRSTVRRLGGFSFRGVPATREMFLGDIYPDTEIATRMIGEVTDGGMVMSAPLPDGTTRIVVCEREAPPRRRTAPPEFSEVAAGWKRITGQDISGSTSVWMSAFGDAAFQVTQYRRGRVLLAGDSAHIHLPAGGQGMNTSLQDAFNLGWKLAAVVRGDAPEALLDSYHDERHPVGKRLLDNTRAQGVLFLRGEEAGPLRDFLGTLVHELDVARFFAAKVSGLDIVYPMGGGEHPLLGRRVPDVLLDGAGGATAALHLLRQGQAVLLDLADSPALRERAEPWADKIVVHTGPESGSDRLSGTKALLVRPDGYVAWTAPHSDQPLEVALSAWCGPSSYPLRATA
ncbi:FAD-dependent monooxygenase [Lolliginicoccus levis]|uniref:FAD-dependent monooxygenase n=1 Tax=Lolliginicoccus levis TaxID=2919542 RepID=UPI00241C054C|nr:FAD-dependent monooxygenase [Lolliginicoccus levis]